MLSPHPQDQTRKDSHVESLEPVGRPPSPASSVSSNNPSVHLGSGPPGVNSISREYVQLQCQQYRRCEPDSLPPGEIILRWIDRDSGRRLEAPVVTAVATADQTYCVFGSDVIDVVRKVTGNEDVGALCALVKKGPPRVDLVWPAYDMRAGEEIDTTISGKIEPTFAFCRQNEDEPQYYLDLCIDTQMGVKLALWFT